MEHINPGRWLKTGQTCPRKFLPKIHDAEDKINRTEKPRVGRLPLTEVKFRYEFYKSFERVAYRRMYRESRRWPRSRN
jgi:hypothetical protein